MRPVCHIVAGPNGAGKSTKRFGRVTTMIVAVERRVTGWLKNLLVQFAAEGQPLTPDVWDRLEEDRRQALADDLAWIARGRVSMCPPRKKRSVK